MWGASGCFLIFKYHSGVTFWAALQPGPKPPHPPEVDRQQYQRSLLALVTERFASYHPVARQLVEASELDSVGAFGWRMHVASGVSQKLAMRLTALVLDESSQDAT